MYSIEPRYIGRNFMYSGPIRLYRPDEVHNKALLKSIKAARFSYFDIINYVILDGKLIAENIVRQVDDDSIGQFYYTKEILEAVDLIRGDSAIY